MRSKLVVTGGLLVALALWTSSCSVWTQVGHETFPLVTGGEGLATVVHADGSTTRFFDGVGSIPASKSSAGWTHVGDPDSAAGLVFEPYQNTQSSVGQKLFAVTAPDGSEVDFIHHDGVGEKYNNSFDAISPDGQWMVSGEWGDMNRLLVMPTPELNPAATDPSADLATTGVIELDQTINDVQGCDFDSPTSLVCAADDAVAERGFPRKYFFDVVLAHALDGSTVTGSVVSMGEVPEESTCAPTGVGSWPEDYEVEGVDVDPITGLLRIESIPPGSCGGTGDIWVYEPHPVPPPSS
jgi:hypothetical protein